MRPPESQAVGTAGTSPTHDMILWAALLCVKHAMPQARTRPPRAAQPNLEIVDTLQIPAGTAPGKCERRQPQPQPLRSALFLWRASLAAAAPIIPVSRPSFSRVPPGKRSIHLHKCRESNVWIRRVASDSDAADPWLCTIDVLNWRWDCECVQPPPHRPELCRAWHQGIPEQCLGSSKLDSGSLTRRVVCAGRPRRCGSRVPTSRSWHEHDIMDCENVSRMFHEFPSYFYS